MKQSSFQKQCIDASSDVIKVSSSSSRKVGSCGNKFNLGVIMESLMGLVVKREVCLNSCLHEKPLTSDSANIKHMQRELCKYWAGLSSSCLPNNLVRATFLVTIGVRATNMQRGTLGGKNKLVHFELTGKSKNSICLV